MFLLGLEIVGLAVVVAKAVKYLPTICSEASGSKIPCSVLVADAVEHSLLLFFVWKYRSVQLLIICLVSLLNIAVLSCKQCKQTKCCD